MNLKNPTGHPQVMVKIGILVDEGIAPLVSALSEFPDIETWDSCQGDNAAPGWGWVSFSHRGGDDALFVFCKEIVKRLSLIKDLGWSLCVRWQDDSDKPYGLLEVPCSAIEGIAQGLREHK